MARPYQKKLDRDTLLYTCPACNYKGSMFMRLKLKAPKCYMCNTTLNEEAFTNKPVVTEISESSPEDQVEKDLLWSDLDFAKDPTVSSHVYTDELTKQTTIDKARCQNFEGTEIGLKTKKSDQVDAPVDSLTEVKTVGMANVFGDPAYIPEHVIDTTPQTSEAPRYILHIVGLCKACGMKNHFHVTSHRPTLPENTVLRCMDCRHTVITILNTDVQTIPEYERYKSGSAYRKFHNAERFALSVDGHCPECNYEDVYFIKSKEPFLERNVKCLECGANVTVRDTKVKKILVSSKHKAITGRANGILHETSNRLSESLHAAIAGIKAKRVNSDTLAVQQTTVAPMSANEAARIYGKFENSDDINTFENTYEHAFDSVSYAANAPKQEIETKKSEGPGRYKSIWPKNLKDPRS